jgi:hypothetical protein
LAYRFRYWTARFLRVAYYILVGLMFLGALALFFRPSAGDDVGSALSISISSIILYGMLALGVRAWAVAIENRDASRRTPTPLLPTS